MSLLAAALSTPEILPDIGQETKTSDAPDPGYLVICWIDPINLMVYVTHVFQVIFGWNRAKAEFHMMQVHNEGKSLLTRESLEKAEHYVHQLHRLWTACHPGERVVKHIKTAENQHEFEFIAREAMLFNGVLDQYPVLSAGYHPLQAPAEKKLMPPTPESQALLHEALSADQRENQQRLQKMRESGPWMLPQENGTYRLTLSSAQIEWLLQMLNDVRVGSWVLLGSPDDIHINGAGLEGKDLLNFMGMELGGYFQMALLEALDS